MRQKLLTASIICSAALAAVPAVAQMTAPPPYGGNGAAPPPSQYTSPYRRPAPNAAPMTDTGARPGHEPGVGPSYPASNNASNINGADSRSQVAPRLPAPAVGESASPRAYLQDAQRALAERRTGAAQEALERAETAFLNNPSNPADPQGGPIGNPPQQTTEQARQALGRGDTAQARQLVDQVLAQMGAEGRPVGGPAMAAPPGSM
ncbi:MAG: hypothetical protein JOZ42_09650 [Acetobacteraceae bacterium]|nr:hypothetical protein [Acetobacteraceae bacterium]